MTDLLDAALVHHDDAVGVETPPFDQQSATIECKINYIRAVAEGEVLCIAKVIHPGRRTLVVEADVLQGDKLVAKAQGTFAVL